MVLFHKNKVYKETSTCLPQALSLFSSSIVSQDPLQLGLSKWRTGVFLEAKIALSLIITGNNNAGFLVIPFCILEPYSVCCIYSAHGVCLDFLRDRAM